MRAARALMSLALCPLIALGAIDSGSWSLAPAEQGKVQFSLRGSNGGHHHFDTSSDWQLTELRGLDWVAATKHDVHFTVVRDAGTIDCQGFVQDQGGAGLFTFKPNVRYAPEMQKLGYAFDEEELFSAFTFDVSFDFVRSLKALSVQGLDAGKLLAFRIHGVTPEFIQGLKSAGIATSDADELIAFRIHGVAPEFVSGLNQLGYPHPPAAQLIALRIHGVSPEYIQGVRSKGLHDLTLEQLVSMRIHGID
jgi:hypothetical protein